LRDVDAFTILDYIKTSIEILMNMKMEEQEGDSQAKNNAVKKGGLRSLKKSGIDGNSMAAISDTESTRSLDEPPKDYEVMLQKYEAEVRNHIKIE
jgi:hypothetical protein